MMRVHELITVSMLLLSVTGLSARAAHTPTAADVLSTMSAAGLEVDVLSAAGVTPSEVAEIVADLRSELSLRFSEYTSARDTLKDAHAARPIDEIAVADATADFDGIISDIYLVAIGDLPATSREMMLAAWPNRSHKLPGKYKFVDRTDEEWDALAGALRKQRLATRHAESLDYEHADLLRRCDAELETFTAQQNLDQYLHLNLTAWRIAVLDTGVGQ